MRLLFSPEAVFLDLSMERVAVPLDAGGPMSVNFRCRSKLTKGIERDHRMAVEAVIRRPKKQIRWTPRLIKQLRGKRTQAEFGALLGTPKNTVWRWEAGQSQPDAYYAARLSALAEREGFLQDWKLVGSMTLVGDLDSASAEIAKLFRQSLARTTRHLAE